MGHAKPGQSMTFFTSPRHDMARHGGLWVVLAWHVAYGQARARPVWPIYFFRIYFLIFHFFLFLLVIFFLFSLTFSHFLHMFTHYFPSFLLLFLFFPIFLLHYFFFVFYLSTSNFNFHRPYVLLGLSSTHEP